MKYRTIFPKFIDKTTCQFITWASKPESIQLLVNGHPEPYEMQKENFGFWSIELPDVSPGLRYKYRIDGKDHFPDPASLSQPEGVHEASEIIDLTDFEWTDNNYECPAQDELIIYELHTGTFTHEGTFNGIRSKLSYLKKLGINTVELLPVAQFSGNRNWGYDGVYPFAVQNSYGGAKELMALVDDCHNHGIAVILDVVYNHFGPEGNYSNQFGHFLTDRYTTPWGQAINFDDEHSDGVRNYFIQNALMWCRDFHFDGLRLDAVHAIYDFSARHFLQELSEKFSELSNMTGRKYFLIAESHLNDVKYISPLSQGGYGIDAQWSDDFHHAIHTLVTGENTGYYMDYGKSQHLSKAIKDAFVYDGKYSSHRKKTYGSSTRNNLGNQFIIFSQNHDQIGNRLNGERLITLSDFETAKVIAGTLFLSPNIPMLFMGEEYCERNPFNYFVSHLDTNLNQLVREGRKKEFEDFFSDTSSAPDPDAMETFEASKLSWNTENDAEKKAMFELYQYLIHLRKTHPVLKKSDKDNLRIKDRGNFFILERWQENNRILAAINFSNTDEKLVIPSDYNFPLVKILDSNDEHWNGTGEICPDTVTFNDEIHIQERSFLIYTSTP